jgi:HK97 gp10 family phage protein
MGNMVDIEIKGLDEIEKRLKQLPQKVAKKVVRKAVREGAKPILKAAQSKVPVKTGALKKSLKVRAMKAKLAKGGAGVHVGVSDQWFKGDLFYGGMVEFGTKNMPAKPFIRPAYDEKKNEAVKVTVKHLLKGIDDIVKQG